ncbi:hypothetical protein [Halalkalibacter akibai]|uniref:Uncharacterized protein n=1 Tax=Halalkalibacter akibai (strain ATCC 43226 / DSM 21942 / CIP 109018 / JCM 9157 / 1139) TaxID=1236973 RepID=W4QVZ7_HALA3|nr:hypothetical protein [Halalkalibacter akibai]GAE36310.1 hypothetical protein JCM9157_3471 [Halalkalibacter akibai JCM 9157]
MSNAKLFKAIYIPDTPFQDEKLKPKKAKKFNFKLEESVRIADTLYRFVYRNNGRQIICFYIVADWKGPYRYLFVEDNELFNDFTSQFGVKGVRGGYWECGMDTYLGDYSSGVVFEKLNKKINGYDEDTPTPICHIYGQDMWHGNAFIVGNRSALEELRNAIDTALKYGEISTTLSPSDGEGYELLISCVEDGFNWDLIDMPYHDPEYFDKPNVPVKAFRRYKLNK